MGSVARSVIAGLWAFVLLSCCCVLCGASGESGRTSGEIPRDPWGEHLSPKLTVNYFNQKTGRTPFCSILPTILTIVPAFSHSNNRRL